MLQTVTSNVANLFQKRIFGLLCVQNQNDFVYLISNKFWCEINNIIDKNNTWIKLKRFFRHHECSESCQCENRESWRDSEQHSYRLWRHNASVTKSGRFQDMTKGICFSYRFYLTRFYVFIILTYVHWREIYL